MLSSQELDMRSYFKGFWSTHERNLGIFIDWRGRIMDRFLRWYFLPRITRRCLASMFAIGAIPGGIISGILGSKFGRKTSIVIFSLADISHWVLMATASEERMTTMMMIGRWIWHLSSLSYQTYCYEVSCWIRWSRVLSEYSDLCQWDLGGGDEAVHARPHWPHHVPGPPHGLRSGWPSQLALGSCCQYSGPSHHVPFLLVSQYVLLLVSGLYSSLINPVPVLVVSAAVMVIQWILKPFNLIWSLPA